MTRRSPMNKRYQKGSEPAGSSRKSAASAKPARDLGESVSHKPAPAKKGFFERLKSGASSGASNTARSVSAGIPTVMTPEIKKYRRIWWIMLGIGAVLLIGVLAVNYAKILPMTTTTSYIVLAAEIIALILVGGCWVLDLKKIRPLMKQAALEEAAGKKKKKKN